jgi:hypothetical protein
MSTESSVNTSRLGGAGTGRGACHMGLAGADPTASRGVGRAGEAGMGACHMGLAGLDPKGSAGF